MLHIDWTYLREINGLSLFFRLTLATLCAGVIGIERGKKNRPAGLRTHMLVCIGAALTMMTNQYIVEVMGFAGDPSRLGAQVISGIGFLGVGTIMVTGKQQVKGLTTAAGLWASACMGLAIGVGFYEGAIMGCIFIFMVMTVLNKLDNCVLGKSKLIDLYIEINKKQEFRNFLKTISKQEFKIKSLEINTVNTNYEGNISFFITLEQTDKKKHIEVMEHIQEIEGVCFIQEV